MRLFKLTDEQGRTIGGMQWGPGVTHCMPLLDSGDPRLSDPLSRGSGFIHAYPDPDLALLLNPGHGDIEHPRLWEVTGTVAHSWWHEVECYSLTTIRELALPGWYLSGRRNVVLNFARLCAEAAAGFDPTAAPDSAGVILNSHCAAALAAQTAASLDIRRMATFAVGAAFAASYAAEAAGRLIDFVVLAGEAIGGEEYIAE